MQRRDFARSALLGAGLFAALPGIGRAAAAPANRNVVFTQADPGHWGPNFAAVHVPQVTVAGGVVSVKTPHEPSEGHYIVSHTVVLADGVYLHRKNFKPMEDPVSEHKLPDGYKGPITVTSACNQHDLWTTTIMV